ncbi:MAG: thiamine pyrophosphate-binding protein [Alphaproteobacteria bacterium]|nr:thiamine pyrophosphate-binding protein [Alphaproteobacteria bacterium]
MNNSDLIVKILKEAGVTHGFGIPSGNVLPLIEAMRLGGIEFVLTAHEGSASFAADVMGRMTGKPGMCIATLGPGATNLATGVGSAYLDRTPMIAITCNLNTPQLGRRIQMWIDHHALFRPITKATLAATKDNVAEVMARALDIAMSEPMGPVHIDLPEDVSLAPAGDTTVSGTVSTKTVPARAVDTDLQAASDLIAKAKRPIAILGSSAMRMTDPSLLKAFVEHHGLPFGTSTMAKGMIDEDHALSFGCIERARRQIQREFIRSADLVIGLGFDTIEVEYEVWVGSVPVLSIDIEDPDVADGVTVSGTVTGDITDSLARMLKMPAHANEWTDAAIAAHRDGFKVALRPKVENFSPHEALDVVRAVVPRDGIITYDVGAHTHQIASQWVTHAPRACHVTNGWSSMGIGIPAAIAAKLARPDLPVVCVIGDGCFQMTCGEVATARRQGLSIPIVVLDDRWLSLIQIKQEKRQYAQWGSQVEMAQYETPPAHYFGVPAVGVRNAAALKSALEAAFKADGPTVIEAVVDAGHYFETVFD